MRGRTDEQPVLFHVFNVEERIREDHPLRDVKRRVDSILKAMSPLFAQAYSRTGRPSIPPAQAGFETAPFGLALRPIARIAVLLNPRSENLLRRQKTLPPPHPSRPGAF
jgi:hypothetical protein